MAERVLDSAPSLLELYPRAVLGAGRSVVGRLPGLGGGEPSLPDTELVVRELEVERDHLERYQDVCDFPRSAVLPPTYPHMLAFPLQMRIMTGADFPFPVIGMVHIRNRIEALRPLDAREKLTVCVRAEGLADHDRGKQFDLRSEIEVEGEIAWRSLSTYLHRSGAGGGSGKSRDKVEPPEPDFVWELPGDAGRRYAAVSGDRNPIHLHPLSARLFGMPRPIAHGMWLKARALAAVAEELPETYEADVSFKLPVPLPSRVAFASWPVGKRRELAVNDAEEGKPHLAGVVSPL